MGASDSRAGAARVPLDLPEGIPMAGYAILSGKGYLPESPAPEQVLRARALYLEDPRGHRVALCVVDLMSSSTWIQRRVVELLASTRTPLEAHELVIAATHTHTAPGHYFGNRIYDHFATSDGLRGFEHRVAEQVARRVAEAIGEAVSRAEPARISILEPEILWGISRNRAPVPFRANPEVEAWQAPGRPGHAPRSLSPTQRAVDPRLRGLAAWDRRGRLIGVFATFGMHNTSLGYRGREYEADWVGRATWHAEQALRHARGLPVVALGLSAAADVSPLPPHDTDTWHGPDAPGPELARFAGRHVGNALIHACHRFHPRHDLELDVWHDKWDPRHHFRHRTRPGDDDPWTVPPDPRRPLPPLARFQFGAPALGGAMDGRTWLHALAPEGRPGTHYPSTHPQHPKLRAFGPFNLLLRIAGMRLSTSHPLHLVRICGHLLATVPVEPTVMASWGIERTLAHLPGVDGVTVVGYAGDYIGYLTTLAEYKHQYYEGGSTVYGRYSALHLAVRLYRLGSTPPNIPLDAQLR